MKSIWGRSLGLSLTRSGAVQVAVVIAATGLTIFAWLATVQANALHVSHNFQREVDRATNDLAKTLALTEAALASLASAASRDAMADAETRQSMADIWLALGTRLGPHTITVARWGSDAPFIQLGDSETVGIDDQIQEALLTEVGSRQSGAFAADDLDTLVLWNASDQFVAYATLTIAEFLSQSQSGLTATVFVDGTVMGALGTQSGPTTRYSTVYGDTPILTEFAAGPDLIAGATLYNARTFLACGLLIDLCVLILLMLMSNRNRTSERTAISLSQELEAEKLQLEASTIALERFAQMSSHDLRTPLRAFHDLQDDLADDITRRFPIIAKDTVFQSHLKQTELLLRRMNRLIDSTFEYTQLSYLLQNVQEFDLRLTVRRLVEKYQTRSISIRTSGDWPIVRCNQRLLTIILENLVMNAIQHHPRPDHARIDLHSKTSDSSLVLSVSDDGNGVDERFHDRIFDMFQTLQPAHQTESAGLGLAIVKRAATLIGGHISLRSDPGTGATFTVMLHGIVAHPSGESDAAA